MVGGVLLLRLRPSVKTPRAWAIPNGQAAAAVPGSASPQSPADDFEPFLRGRATSQQGDPLIARG